MACRAQALLLQRVPAMWANVSYLSLKPLGSWFKELVARVEFMATWIREGPPDAFWMSAFFFPQGYMTAALQVTRVRQHQSTEFYSVVHNGVI